MGLSHSLSVAVLPGWFSGRPASLLEELFGGFFSLYKNHLWKRALRDVLYWYLRANNTSEGAGVDGGIILAQAALEKLAWVYLVHDAKIVAKKQFAAWQAYSEDRGDTWIYGNTGRYSGPTTQVIENCQDVRVEGRSDSARWNTK